MRKKRTTSKASTKIEVTGRGVVYIQRVAKSGKLGKAQPVVLTTVRGKRKAKAR